mgnify:FL=1
MLLITEQNDQLNYLTEEDENGKKNLFIEGIFMQAEQKNRNGRIYEKKVLFNEAKRYEKNYVNENRAMGELGHPNGPTVNLERVSHKITELRYEGNDVYGKAKILDTPYGKIVKDLMNDGVRLGVSTRGMGSLEERDGAKYVGKDFMLAAVDIVADPSAPDAFVDGIMEGKEWVWNNGILKEQEIQCYKSCLCKTKNVTEDQKIRMFENFMSKLQKF